MYSAVLRLYSMGFVDHVVFGMRPWIRENVVEFLGDVEDRIAVSSPSLGTDQAQQIYYVLQYELRLDMQDRCDGSANHLRFESAFRGMSGTPLRDSFHLGSTLINDYARPYESGFNSYFGLSGFASAGRFTFYARGEFLRGPSAAGYSSTLANAFSAMDQTHYTDPATKKPLRISSSIREHSMEPR
jgi:Capsule assembly protein Wzi